VKLSTIAFALFNTSFAIYFLMMHFVWRESFVLSVKKSLKYSTAVLAVFGLILVCALTSYSLAHIFWRSIL